MAMDGTATPGFASSWRRRALAASFLGHLLALAAWAAGHGWPAVVILLASGAVLVWGTLHPHSRLFGPVAKRLDTARPVVWLSFDDGPSPDTPALLDLLRERDARACFFLVGARARRWPEAARAIVDQGHEIGNHTFSHPSGRFWALPPGAMAREIDQAQQVLTEVCGQRPRWFRAVAGHANPFVQPALERVGLSRVSWSGRGFDGVDADDDRVIARLCRAIAPGAILMLHEDATRPGRSVRLLRRLLDEIAARGYTVVAAGGNRVPTTSQLLNGVRPQSGEVVGDSPSPASSASRPARVG